MMVTEFLWLSNLASSILVLYKCLCNQTHDKFNSSDFLLSVFCLSLLYVQLTLFSAYAFFFGHMVYYWCFFFLLFFALVFQKSRQMQFCAFLLVSWPLNIAFFKRRIMIWFQEIQLFLKQDIQGIDSCCITWVFYKVQMVNI